MKILVLKFGGSMMRESAGILEVIKESAPLSRYDKIVIVPGGGFLADGVRELNPDDDAAHWMAVLAMEQFGHYLSSRGIAAYDSFADLTASDERICVFLPYRAMRAHDDLPHSWDVTSDSIAAWTAVNLSEKNDAELVLFKSVDGLRRRGDGASEVMEVYITDCARHAPPEKFDEIDNFLLGYLAETKTDCILINGRNTENVRNFFAGRKFCGTRILTHS